MGEKQPPADPDGESVTAVPPDVIDLRGNGHSARRGVVAPNGSADPSADAKPAAPASGGLTATEWWDWASLRQQISDLQSDTTRRIAGRVVVSQRTHVSSFGPRKAPEVVEEQDVVEAPDAAAETETEPEVAEEQDDAEFETTPGVGEKETASEP